MVRLHDERSRMGRSCPVIPHSHEDGSSLTAAATKHGPKGNCLGSFSRPCNAKCLYCYSLRAGEVTF